MSLMDEVNAYDTVIQQKSAENNQHIFCYHKYCHSQFKYIHVCYTTCSKNCKKNVF